MLKMTYLVGFLIAGSSKKQHITIAAVEALFAATTEEDSCTHLLSYSQLASHEENAPFDVILGGSVQTSTGNELTMQLSFAACLARLCAKARKLFTDIVMTLLSVPLSKVIVLHAMRAAPHPQLMY